MKLVTWKPATRHELPCVQRAASTCWGCCLGGRWRTGAVVGERIIKGDDTRDAEAAADAFAYAALLDADLPPSAIATLFSRLALQSCEDAGIMEHLMSHPALWGRISAARAAEPEGAKFRPVLSESEYEAQRAICY
jgi:predicted Zn-dependent protease